MQVAHTAIFSGPKNELHSFVYGKGMPWTTHKELEASVDGSIGSIVATIPLKIREEHKIHWDVILALEKMSNRELNMSELLSGIILDAFKSGVHFGQLNPKNTR